MAAHEWQELRRRVALAGVVTDVGTGKPVVDATVEIVAGPVAFEKLRRRAPQRAVTATGRDGLFHFLDLPAGQYDLNASVEQGSRLGAAKAKVRVRAAQSGALTPGYVEMSLPPTRIEGRVLDPDGAPVRLATVRVRGESGSVLTGADGSFVLRGIELGSRRLEVTANGFVPGGADVTLTRVGAAKNVGVKLAPASS